MGISFTKVIESINVIPLNLIINCRKNTLHDLKVY
jgi:hypothetical protein